jgi:CheY-like chemotaxis protein
LNQNKTVLIIEQNADIRRCLKEVIEMEGYRVVATENQAMATSLLRAMEKPALLLADNLTIPKRDPALDSLPVATLNRPINIENLLDAISQIN